MTICTGAVVASAWPALASPPHGPARVPTRRRYLMCRPDFFDVAYAINPWMDPTRRVDRGRAIDQWETLRATFVSLGHSVDLLQPEPGLPDMVFAANGAFVVGDRALGARFRAPVRAAEAVAHRERLEAFGVHVSPPVAVNEGEGDIAWAYGRILAGAGFRTEPAARAELEAVFGLPVVALDLVDPRYYHLDIALAVLDPTTVAYLPSAFTLESQRRIRTLYPDAIEVPADEAAVLALNCVSDGYHVVLAAQAPRFAATLRARGFEPVPVDASELLAAGGGIKCMTLERHQPVRRDDHGADRARRDLVATGEAGRAVAAGDVTMVMVAPRAVSSTLVTDRLVADSLIAGPIDADHSEFGRLGVAELETDTFGSDPYARIVRTPAAPAQLQLQHAQPDGPTDA